MLSSLQKQANTAAILANAGEIASRIIQDIAGNDISNSINGSKITSEIIQTLCYQRINKCLLNQNKTM